MILLDTDVCIELLKGNRRILLRRDQYDEPIGVCFMTVAELYYGAEKSKEPRKNIDIIEQLLLTLEIIHTDMDILRRFGATKATLQRQGILIPDADILIASATLEKAERLITGNSKRFNRVNGLALEDWTR
ncbi:MAG: PIN domain-containing protein [Candidatus Eisenbacteria bacterium]|nr:PIN domain-containing protein [Candidatus Eisenbacteria bacterium]